VLVFVKREGGGESRAWDEDERQSSHGLIADISDEFGAQ
jgi:hypothetical protein